MSFLHSFLLQTIILLLALSFTIIPIIDAAKNPIKQPTYHRDIASAICPVKLEDRIWIPPMRQGYGGYYKTTYTAEGLEFYNVKTYFEDNLNYEVKTLAEEEAKYSEIIKILKGEYGKPKYVHIVTHGKPGPALEVRNGKNWWEWWKSDWKDLTPKDIKNNLRENGMSGCKLVFLSACYSLQNYKTKDFSKNFGYVFVKWCDVSFVIGSKDKINSWALSLFATYFYDAYFSGEGISMAFHIAADKAREVYENIPYAEQLTEAIIADYIIELLKLSTKWSIYSVILHVADAIAGALLTEALGLDNLVIVDETTYRSSGGGGGIPPVIM